MGSYDKGALQWAELCREFNDRRAELFQLLRAANAPFGDAEERGWYEPAIDMMDPVDAAEARLTDVQERMKAFITRHGQTRH
jgi:hypothetical protein